MDLHLLHPVSVHLALGSAFILLITETLSYVKPRPDLFTAGHLLYPVTLGLVFLTVGTGLVAKNSVLIPEAARAVFDYHQSAAFVFFILILFAGINRLSQIKKHKIQKTNPASLTLLYLSFFLAVFTGFTGGHLVYGFGTGVLK